MTPQEKFTLELEKLKQSLIKHRKITEAIVKNVKETIEIIDKLKAVFLITILGIQPFYVEII